MARKYIEKGSVDYFGELKSELEFAVKQSGKLFDLLKALQETAYDQDKILSAGLAEENNFKAVADKMNAVAKDIFDMHQSFVPHIVGINGLTQSIKKMQ